jgi:hypothetical protein
MFVQKKILTNLTAGNSNYELVLPNGVNYQFLFYYNELSLRIGFNLSISGDPVYSNVNMSLAPNMLAPLTKYGTLYISGDFPTISTIDGTAVLIFEITI